MADMFKRKEFFSTHSYSQAASHKCSSGFLIGGGESRLDQQQTLSPAPVHASVSVWDELDQATHMEDRRVASDRDTNELDAEPKRVDLG